MANYTIKDLLKQTLEEIIDDEAVRKVANAAMHVAEAFAFPYFLPTVHRRMNDRGVDPATDSVECALKMGGLLTTMVVTAGGAAYLVKNGPSWPYVVTVIATTNLASFVYEKYLIAKEKLGDNARVDNSDNAEPAKLSRADKLVHQSYHRKEGPM